MRKTLQVKLTSDRALMLRRLAGEVWCRGAQFGPISRKPVSGRRDEPLKHGRHDSPLGSRAPAVIVAVGTTTRRSPVADNKGAMCREAFVGTDRLLTCIEFESFNYK